MNPPLEIAALGSTTSRWHVVIRLRKALRKLLTDAALKFAVAVVL